MAPMELERKNPSEMFRQLLPASSVRHSPPPVYPAKYVSGYLSTVPPPGRARLIGADATHAWVSVFCGEIGWIDIDPTNDQIPSDRHILVARGRDYDDVSPVKGVILGGGAHTITVSVDVRPIQVGDSEL